MVSRKRSEGDRIDERRVQADALRDGSRLQRRMTDETNCSDSPGSRRPARPGLLTVNMKELPDPASSALLAMNPSVNNIYATNDLDEEQDFFPVIDAIQGDGFNPLWHQVLIHFTGSLPRQFCSDDEVLAAAAAGDTTLEETDEVYRCSVVGAK